MALERKDLRLKLDDEVHRALSVVARVRGLDMAEWAEKVVARAVRRELHAAMLLADEAKRQGISGNALPADD